MIKTDKEYREALKRIEELTGGDGDTITEKEGLELDSLCDSVAEYEESTFEIPNSTFKKLNYDEFEDGYYWFSYMGGKPVIFQKEGSDWLGMGVEHDVDLSNYAYLGKVSNEIKL